MDSVNTILTIYIWVIVGIHLFFLLAIARFYENKANQRTYYQLFLLPAMLLLLAAFRYAFISALVGDWWGDILRFLGGLLLIIFGLLLLQLMTGSRP